MSMRMETAHLCMHFAVIAGAPVLRDVGIYSAGPDGLAVMGDAFYAEVRRVVAPTYHEAHEIMLREIATDPRFAWARPFFELNEG